MDLLIEPLWTWLSGRSDGYVSGNMFVYFKADLVKQEANRAKQKAEQKASEAEQRAEQLAARLRAMGVDPEGI